MPSPPATPALDFECHLPDGQMWFTVSQVARHWEISVQHVINLINEGRFSYDNIGPVDLCGDPGKARTTTRIPRACLIAFLQSSRHIGPLFSLRAPPSL